jgi:hypothetical protein
MKLRSIVITVAVLAALSVAAYLKNRPEAPQSGDPRVGTVLLDSGTAAKAASITISDQGKTVELRRDADGAWKVTGYFGFPADFEKVSRLVQDLNGSKIERLVTENPDRIARLEFKDSSVAIRDASGKEVWKVLFGKSPETGNGRFVQFAGEAKAYLSGTRVFLDTDAKGWADTLIATAKPEDVAKVTLTFPEGGRVTAERKAKDAAWTTPDAPAGKALIGEKITSALSALTSIRFSDTVDPKDAGAADAAKFQRTLTLETFSGRTVTIAMGRKPEEKKLKAPVADSKGTLADLAKDAGKKPDDKTLAPEFETVPAGPVFVSVANSDADAPVNALMKLRAFQTEEYTFTGLPQKADELFESAKAK